MKQNSISQFLPHQYQQDGYISTHHTHTCHNNNEAPPQMYMNNRQANTNFGPEMKQDSFLIPYKHQISEGTNKMNVQKQINETSLMSPVGMTSQGKENKLFNLVFEQDDDDKEQI